MDNKQTRSIVTDADRKKLKQAKLSTAGDKRVITDAIANCQLMLERGGALFEFPLPPQTAPVFLGREKQETEPSITIDLAPFSAHELGVSRMHARFERAGSRLFLRDLNSTNGTWVNGKRLTPMQVQEINHGDRIEFGRLATKLYIKA